MNKQLAKAVAAKTTNEVNVDLVELVIHNHQTQFPGSWQDWTIEGKTAPMVKLMNAAHKAGETSPERIMQLA